jgi:hypothetical protein
MAALLTGGWLSRCPAMVANLGSGMGNGVGSLHQSARVWEVFMACMVFSKVAATATTHGFTAS